MQLLIGETDMGEEKPAQLGFIRREDMAVEVLWRGNIVRVEKKCPTCVFGAITETADPCKSCFNLHTPENPYHGWEFDPEYCPEEDKF
jgi:hypothetical protein